MNADELMILGDKMDAVDLDLHAAEVSRDTKKRIELLHRRARIWRDYRRMLVRDGRDWSGAELAAQRDECTAYSLAVAR